MPMPLGTDKPRCATEHYAHFIFSMMNQLKYMFCKWLQLFLMVWYLR